MFEHELDELNKRNLLRRAMVIESSNGPTINIDKKRLLLMCSNDYLGLAGHPALREAACAAMERFGFGAGASRLVSGTSPLHQELENSVARFKGTQAAILFNSGYAANTGILQSIAGERDMILSDSLNHASIIDGCRLSKARVLVYRHGDVNHVEDLLKKTDARRRFIVTDGIFSMDGDLAPLPDLAGLAEKYGAFLVVDDAHATGVLGNRGRGTSEYFNLGARVLIQMGTFSKAFGSFGAFAAGDDDVIQFLINRSRSFIFSTALPPAVCAASLAAIDIVEEDVRLRSNLWQLRKRLLEGLEQIGISYGKTESPIIPLVVGAAEHALRLANRLFELGVYATAIRPPTVAEDAARIRLTVTAAHSSDDIDSVLEALNTCKQENLV
jgi:8-amino-7-oxononanoate synthase